MRKKLVKLLFHMLCAAAIVAGLCAAATALQVDGLTLEAGTLPPVAYQLEVIYEPVKCAKIEEINFGPGGDFAILHTRPTGIAGEFSIEDIRYISYYNAAGNQQFSLRLEETQDVKLKLTDTHLYVCLFPKLIEHDLQTTKQGSTPISARPISGNYTANGMSTNATRSEMGGCINPMAIKSPGRRTGGTKSY